MCFSIQSIGFGIWLMRGSYLSPASWERSDLDTRYLFSMEPVFLICQIGVNIWHGVGGVPMWCVCGICRHGRWLTCGPPTVRLKLSTFWSTGWQHRVMGSCIGRWTRHMREAGRWIILTGLLTMMGQKLRDGTTDLLDRDSDFKGQWLSPFYLYSCLWENFNLFLVLENNKVVMF